MPRIMFILMFATHIALTVVVTIDLSRLLLGLSDSLGPGGCGLAG